MKKITTVKIIVLLVFLIPSYLVQAKEEKNKIQKTDCQLQFTLKSWSVFYKSGKGQGVITCDNGQTSRVKIRTHGGGLTFGKSKIIDGKGNFSKVVTIKDLFGNYVASEAHAGASDTAEAQALWKGDVGLTLAGTGKGWNLGFAFGNFKIERIK